MNNDLYTELYNYLYSSAEAAETDHKLNHVGWNSSITKLAYTDQEMYEWRDDTVDAMLSCHPKRILEIGCGTGMMLFSLIDRIDWYTGIDLSEKGIEYVSSRLNDEQKARSSFHVLDVDELQTIEENGFDLVIMNSASQYMGGEEHFAGIMAKCADKLVEGGKIFIGDVKEEWNRRRFYEACETYGGDRRDLEKRIASRQSTDFEFYMSREYLEGMCKYVPRIKGVDILSKRGSFPTEMNLFRFNAILHLDNYSERETEKTDCSGKSRDEILELISSADGTRPVKYKNIKNRLLVNYYKEALEEEFETEDTLFIQEAESILRERGYRTLAYISGNDRESFDIEGWKE